MLVSVATQQAGDTDGGIKVAEQALAFADHALDENPGNIELRETAAYAATQLSVRLMEFTMERASAAEAKARERWRALVQIDPENFSYRYQFAGAHAKETEFLYAAGKKVEAGAALERYISLLSPVAHGPGDFYVLQSSESKRAALAAQFGHHETARMHLDQVHAWHRTWVAALAPDVARHAGVLGGYLDDQCRVLEMLSDWPELERQGRAMLDVVNDARRLEPHVPGISGARSIAGYYFGRALLRQGRAGEVVPILQEAVHDLDASDLRNWSSQVLAGTILATKVPLAEALIAVGDVQQARVLLEANLAAGKALVKENTTVWWEWRAELAETAFLLTTVLDPSEPGEAERREALLARAQAILDAHAAESTLSVHEAELLAKIKAAARGRTCDRARIGPYWWC